MGKGQIQFLEATDEAGELVTSWPDNAYELGIVAPPSSTAGFVVLSQVLFSEIDNELTVNLPPRQAVEGMVWSPSGPPSMVQRCFSLGSVTLTKTIQSSGKSILVL